MNEPRVINLWPDGCENNISAPAERQKLTIYAPQATSGKPRAAVVICPGGGYVHLGCHEGEPYARLLADNGIVGVVVNYRVAPHRFPAPMADACRAIRLVRSLAGELNIDPNRVGIWGSSAGGHLAATTATQPNLHIDPLDDLAGVPARPDRLILCYPVISFSADFHHGVSSASLLGADASDEQRRQLSNELHVTADNPQTFIFHTADDEGVPVENSLLFSRACARAGVSVELHVYEHGCHGLGLAGDFPKLRSWPALLVSWLSDWRE